MTQELTINETMVTQKICYNCSWMKSISSYLHPFFLLKREETNNSGLYSTSHDIMTTWNSELKEQKKVNVKKLDITSVHVEDFNLTPRSPYCMKWWRLSVIYGTSKLPIDFEFAPMLKFAT